MSSGFRSLAGAVAGLLLAAPAHAQGADSALTIRRIFSDNAFRSAPLPVVNWLSNGRSYLDTREASSGGGSDIIRIDLVTGDTTVIAAASSMMDENGKRIEVEDIALSGDETRALLFHSSERVWRDNTRGRYHIIDLASRRITPASSRPGLQMFAKLSPDARQVAFVRGNNLFVTDLATGNERQLTTDGSADIINGTSDWVHEEELGLRDAFRWSPDGRKIAYWRFDQSAVKAFPVVDELGLYPRIDTLKYPKAGERNSLVRVGVYDLSAGATKWIDLGTDTSAYIARMEWSGPDSVVILRLPRKQNRADLLMASAATGGTRLIASDRDSAYVDVSDPVWIENGRRFLWISDRTGWAQVHLFDRRGRHIRQVTADGMDVLSIDGVDEARGDVYVTAFAPDPTQRQLFRYTLKGNRVRGQRLTTAPGVHTVTVGPGARFLVDVHSTITQPARATLHALPSMREERVLQDNAALRARVQSLGLRAPEFFRIPSSEGVVLDAYRILPTDFDSTKRYPVLMYVYGGPASPVVSNSWGGNRYFYHNLLAREGYIVVAVDNRGAAWRGRDFRKITQYQLGKYESRDQIDAARWLARQPWVDGSRIGIWGWSYGGYLSALSAALGGSTFKAAIVVAPVSDWRLYDTIYTERFLWLPSENPSGYKDGSPVTHAAKMEATLLLVHGTGDDNVHPQNTIQLANALQEAGKPFWMLMYPNKTHSISGGATQAHLHESFVRFLKANL